MSKYTDQRAWICETIMSELPGADPSAVDRVFDRKLDEFLQQSACWIEERTLNSDQFGNVRLDFSHINAEVVWTMMIESERQPLRRTSYIANDRRTERGKRPILYTNTPYPDVLELWPIPLENESHEVVARCALRINDCTAAEVPVPDWIFSRYKEALRCGVLSEMQNHQGRAYANPLAAAQHGTSFRNWIGKARDEARRGFGMNDSEWRFPRGGFLA